MQIAQVPCGLQLIHALRNTRRINVGNVDPKQKISRWKETTCVCRDISADDVSGGVLHPCSMAPTPRSAAADHGAEDGSPAGRLGSKREDNGRADRDEASRAEAPAGVRHAPPRGG